MQGFPAAKRCPGQLHLLRTGQTLLPGRELRSKDAARSRIERDRTKQVLEIAVQFPEITPVHRPIADGCAGAEQSGTATNGRARSAPDTPNARAPRVAPPPPITPPMPDDQRPNRKLRRTLRCRPARSTISHAAVSDPGTGRSIIWKCVASTECALYASDVSVEDIISSTSGGTSKMSDPPFIGSPVTSRRRRSHGCAGSTRWSEAYTTSGGQSTVRDTSSRRSAVPRKRVAAFCFALGSGPVASVLCSASASATNSGAMPASTAAVRTSASLK